MRATTLATAALLVAMGTPARADGGANRDDGGDANSGGQRADGGAAVDAALTPDAGTSPAAVAPPPDAPRAAPPAALPVGRITGRVLVKGSHLAIALASITVDVTPAGETDGTGAFAIDVPCGVHHVIVLAGGFAVATVERDPCVDPTPMVIRLAPSDAGPRYESVVRARRAGAPPSVKVEGPELVKTPGTLGDPFRAIEALPGVASVAWPAPIYAVRGANPGNTGFFLDDLRVPALFHLALGPSVIHPYFFDSLDFYPGGYPARYGRYVAGIVAARTREPAADTWHASVDVRLYDAGALVSAPLPDGNGAVAVAGRYSYTGAVISLLSDALDLSYWDYQLRVDRNVGPARVTLLALGSSDHLVSKGPSMPPPVALAFQRVSLRAAMPAGDGRVLASLAVGIDHTEAPIADYRLSIDARSLSPRLAFRRPTARADLEIGVEGELQRFAPLTPIMRPNTLDLIHGRDARLLAAYASLAVRAGDRLTLTPELRLDSYTIADTARSDLGPRLSARLALDDRTSIVAAGGRFTQTPSLALQVPGAESFGLALYGLQSSWQGSVGVETRGSFGLEVAATGFVQRYVLTDLRDPTLTHIDPLADDLLVRRDALSYGLELMIRRPQTERLSGWLAYTLSSNRRALGGGVIGPSDWDQRHILNLVLGYRIGAYTVGGRAHLNTGRPVLVKNESDYEFQRLPTFYQIDVRAERRFLFDRVTVNFYVELVNATLNREVVGISMDDEGRQERSFRIVIPSIGVHGEL